MCIAIVKPKEIILSKDTLKTCAENNPDGMGFAYCKDGHLYIKKYLKDFEAFYNDYKEVENESNMLIHFRIATHGEVNVENCHPFKLNNRMALIHNGVISGYGDKKEKSDTLDFIDKVIGNISWKMWHNPSFRTLVGESIGYSKLGILDVSGEYFIINEEKGSWEGGVWYSNNSYKPKTYTYNKSYDTTSKKEKYDGYKSIFKCSKCNKEFKVNGYKYWTKCPSCKSYTNNNIGYEMDGKRYDYDYDSSYDDYYTCYA